MSTIRAVTEQDVPIEDQVQLLACLKQWKAEGQVNPMIPCDIDADGDGTTDAFGLGPFGDLVFVTQVPVKNTVYEADGSGLEGGQG
ncbi:hypothetical protein SEA_QUADZERO_22 [Microbacterium phage QuadZero]|nr:hypothetical protein SEA_QUADZERO_22 [Microbacterium phage QuadZero]